MKDVHQTTVDSYLEDIIVGTVNENARERALKEAKEHVAQINKVVDDLEQQGKLEEILDYRTFSYSKANPYSKPNWDFLLKQKGKRISKIGIPSW